MFNHTLQQFHTIAIAHKLSAAAILLWQQIYFTAEQQGTCTGLCLRTADLIEALDITRNGLQKVRHTLTNAGLLQVRIDDRQRVYYTLMLDGKIIDEKSVGADLRVFCADARPHDVPGESQNHGTAPMEKSVGAGSARPHDVLGESQNHGTANPSPTVNRGDIIHNNAYRKLVDAFCAQYDNQHRITLEIALQQFFYKRKQKGKTLTRAGLDALLHKLVTLAENNIRTMIDIVNQSINRGWTGFYPCTSPVNGRAACPHATAIGGYPYPAKPSRMPKYDTKYEDLDFLEW